jgi:hypothetical protein
LTSLTILFEMYALCSVSLRCFLQRPVLSSLFGKNILLSTLFSNILSLCPIVNITERVSNPYRTRDKIIVYYILIFTF